MTANASVSPASVIESPRTRAALRQAIYAPIDEHRTAASDSDVAAAWLAAVLVALVLVATVAV